MSSTPESLTRFTILLLTAPPGCSKTTGFEQVAAHFGDLRLAGFLTRELREQGHRVGFATIGLGGRRVILAHGRLRSLVSVGRYGIEPDRLTYIVSTGHTHVTYTRMRAPYVNPEGFRFTIYRKGLFSELGKLLGMQDIEVGDPDFDEAFIIEGSDEFRVRNLFASPQIRQMLRLSPRSGWR